MQLRRTEKRYVPQQESYRNLPGVPAVATPTDVVPTPAGPEAELGRIASGLSAFHQGLLNFMQTQQSFEETNRAEAIVRGRLGLEEDAGFLDFGTRQGYETGKAMDDADELVVAVRRHISDEIQSYTPDKFPDADSLRQHVDHIVSSKMAELGVSLRDKPDSYLRGIGNKLSELRLEMRVEALSAYDAQTKIAVTDAVANDTRSWLDTDVIPSISALVSDPNRVLMPQDIARIREGISERSLKATTDLNVDRDTANVLILESAHSTIQNYMATALSTDASYGSIVNIEQTLGAIWQAVDSPDAAGYRLGTTSTAPAVKTAVDRLRNTVVNFSNTADRVRAKQQKLQREQEFGKVYTSVFTGKKTFDQAMDELKGRLSSGDIEEALVPDIISSMLAQQSAGAFAPLSREDNLTLIRSAASGEYTSTELLLMAQELQADSKTVASMLQMYDRTLQLVDRSNAELQREMTMKNFDEEQRRRQQAENRKQNAVTIATITANMPDQVRAYVLDRLRPHIADDRELWNYDALNSLSTALADHFVSVEQEHATREAQLQMAAKTSNLSEVEQKREKVLNAQLKLQMLYPPSHYSYGLSAIALNGSYQEYLTRKQKEAVIEPLEKGEPAWTTQLMKPPAVPTSSPASLTNPPMLR